MNDNKPGKGIHRDYILLYAVASFLSVALWAKAWKIADTDQASFGEIYGLTFESIFVPNYLFPFLIIGSIFLSFVLGFIAFFPKTHRAGLIIIKVLSIPFGLTMLASFTDDWLETFSLLAGIDDVPKFVNHVVFYAGAAGFFGLSGIVAILPWLDPRPSWPKITVLAATSRIKSAYRFIYRNLSPAATVAANSGLRLWWLGPLVSSVTLFSLVASNRLDLAVFSGLLAATVAGAALLFQVGSSVRQEKQLATIASALSVEPFLELFFADDSHEVALAADWSQPVQLPVRRNLMLGREPSPLPPGHAPVLFLVRNSGEIQAENVNIFIDLPDGCSVVEQRGNFLISSSMKRPWQASRKKRNQIRISGDKLEPNLHIIVYPQLHLVFPGDSIKYTLSYTAYSGNKPTPDEGELVVDLAVRGTDPTKEFPGVTHPWDENDEEV